MNSNIDMTSSLIEIDDDTSKESDDDQKKTQEHQTETRSSRSNLIETASSSSTNNGAKRQKDISPCYVCGAKAHGYNFDQITCESCKAFFRRNALKSMDKFRCRNNNNCVITSTTRKRCKRCRLTKCFKVGMRKEWILTEEEKRLKRRKIERNRLIKQQAQLAVQQQHHHNNEKVYKNFQTTISSSTLIDSASSSPYCQHPKFIKSSESRILPMPLIYMHRPLDKQMYERQHLLLKQLSDGYQLICKKNPQPNKFAYRNGLISQTIDMESKLVLVKDLTRELTQMTTSRLLHYFTLIPEFQLLTELEKKSILIKNMLAVFMFHGALTYNAESDTLVDSTTGDQPYDAKYLLFVYGPRIYNNFITLARQLTSVAYQSLSDKESVERAHKLFLLLMVILLFSDGFDSDFQMFSNEHGQPQSVEYDTSRASMNRSLSTTSESTSTSSSISSLSSSNSTFSPLKLNEKLHKIQQIYIELACRYLHDELGLTIGRQLFQNLLPLLYDLQKLCSILANVNLCEFAEEDDRSSSSKAITSNLAPISSDQQTSQISPSQFNSTMISNRAHLNELQKENRAPPPSNAILASPNGRSSLTNTSNSMTTSPSVLSNSMPTYENYQV